MTDSTPDYSRYSQSELEDVLAHIDRANFPERYQLASEMLAQSKAANVPEASTVAPPAEQNAKPKWSENHITTKLFWVLLCTSPVVNVPLWLADFIGARHVIKFNGIGVGLGIGLAILLFVSLIYDEKLLPRLMDGWRGKLAIVTLPLVCLVMGAITGDSLRLLLHTFAEQQSTQLVFEYEKIRGRKHCRHRIRLLANERFEKGELCLSKATLNRMPEQGRVNVFGSVSEYGLMIDRYRFLSR